MDGLVEELIYVDVGPMPDNNINAFSIRNLGGKGVQPKAGRILSAAIVACSDAGLEKALFIPIL